MSADVDIWVLRRVWDFLVSVRWERHLRLEIAAAILFKWLILIQVDLLTPSV